MLSNAGFQIIADQMVHDALIDNLVISGNEVTVVTRLTELLGGQDELIVSLVPITGTGEDEQQAQL